MLSQNWKTPERCWRRRMYFLINFMRQWSRWTASPISKVNRANSGLEIRGLKILLMKYQETLDWSLRILACICILRVEDLVAATKRILGLRQPAFQEKLGIYLSNCFGQGKMITSLISLTYINGWTIMSSWMRVIGFRCGMKKTVESMTLGERQLEENFRG